MDRIHYRCEKAELKVPLAQRKNWHVYMGDVAVATIGATQDPSSDRSHSLRIWKAKMNHNAFDPFEFEHKDNPDEEKTKPHVILSDDGPTLVNPQPMTMREARSWVKHVLNREQGNQK